jgi:hypothetical protein
MSSSTISSSTITGDQIDSGTLTTALTTDGTWIIYDPPLPQQYDSNTTWTWPDNNASINWELPEARTEIAKLKKEIKALKKKNSMMERIIKGMQDFLGI